MMTREEISGKWNQVKGAVLERYGQLTEEDLTRAQGDVQRLVGIVQERTGRAREEIERFLRSSMDDASSMAQHVADASSQYYADAADRVRDGYDRLSESAQYGYVAARKALRRNPMESVLIAFGAGIFAGVLVSMSMRSGRR